MNRILVWVISGLTRCTFPALTAMTGYPEAHRPSLLPTGIPSVIRTRATHSCSGITSTWLTPTCSWIRGAHSIRFGVEYNNAQLNHFQPQGGAFGTPRGSFNFAGSVTALNGGPAANKANSLAQFLLGVADRSGKVVQNDNPNALRWHTWSAYVRDRWQVTPNLTLNYGVRWEYYPFPTHRPRRRKAFQSRDGQCAHWRERQHSAGRWR